MFCWDKFLLKMILKLPIKLTTTSKNSYTLIIIYLGGKNGKK